MVNKVTIRVNLDRGKVEVASLHPITGARHKVGFFLLLYIYHLYTIKYRCTLLYRSGRYKKFENFVTSLYPPYSSKNPVLWSLLLNINTMAVMISSGFICIIKLLTTFSSACFHYNHIKKHFL